jgi:hypothetical protein
MANWSSFEKQQLLTENWRKFVQNEVVSYQSLTGTTDVQLPGEECEVEIEGTPLAAIDSLEYPDSLINALCPLVAAETIDQEQLTQILQYFKERAEADGMSGLMEIDLSAAGEDPRKFSQETADGLAGLLQEIGVEADKEFTDTLIKWLRSNTLTMPRAGAAPQQPVDLDGDGKPDTTGTDTDGDGVADTVDDPGTPEVVQVDVEDVIGDDEEDAVDAACKELLAGYPEEFVNKQIKDNSVRGEMRDMYRSISLLGDATAVASAAIAAGSAATGVGVPAAITSGTAAVAAEAVATAADVGSLTMSLLLLEPKEVLIDMISFIPLIGNKLGKVTKKAFPQFFKQAAAKTTTKAVGKATKKAAQKGGENLLEDLMTQSILKKFPKANEAAVRTVAKGFAVKGEQAAKKKLKELNAQLGTVIMQKPNETHEDYTKRIRKAAKGLLGKEQQKLNAELKKCLRDQQNVFLGYVAQGIEYVTEFINFLDDGIDYLMKHVSDWFADDDEDDEKGPKDAEDITNLEKYLESTKDQYEYIKDIVQEPDEDIPSLVADVALQEGKKSASREIRKNIKAGKYGAAARRLLPHLQKFKKEIQKDLKLIQDRTDSPNNAIKQLKQTLNNFVLYYELGVEVVNTYKDPEEAKRQKPATEKDVQQLAQTWGAQPKQQNNEELLKESEIHRWQQLAGINKRVI